jgi:hypothetical protein
MAWIETWLIVRDRQRERIGRMCTSSWAIPASDFGDIVKLPGV